MGIVRVHVIVTGRVQGVFFRDYTAKEAARIRLSGWVRNRDNGTVEAEFQGDEEDVSRMVHWLHKGSPMSQVVGVDTAFVEVLAAESGFMVKY